MLALSLSSYSLVGKYSCLWISLNYIIIVIFIIGIIIIVIIIIVIIIIVIIIIVIPLFSGITGTYRSVSADGRIAQW